MFFLLRFGFDSGFPFLLIFRRELFPQFFRSFLHLLLSSFLLPLFLFLLDDVIVITPDIRYDEDGTQDCNGGGDYSETHRPIRIVFLGNVLHPGNGAARSEQDWKYIEEKNQRQKHTILWNFQMKEMAVTGIAKKNGQTSSLFKSFMIRSLVWILNMSIAVLFYDGNTNIHIENKLRTFILSLEAQLYGKMAIRSRIWKYC